MQETPLSRDTVDHTNPVSYLEGIGTECAIIAFTYYIGILHIVGNGFNCVNGVNGLIALNVLRLVF